MNTKEKNIRGRVDEHDIYAMYKFFYCVANRLSLILSLTHSSFLSGRSGSILRTSLHTTTTHNAK